MRFSRRILPTLAALILGLLTGCGAGQPATTQPAAIAPAATAPTTGMSGIPTSVTAEGYHVLGQASAPITIAHFSDFL